MRRATIMEYDKLGDKLSKYVGQMKFRFMDLCVKAEPGALLNVKALIENEALPLEDCAKIAKPDDYHFMLIPNYEEDLVAIEKAVLFVHPEFKIAVDSLQVDTVDENGNQQAHDVKYLNVTMPEVNDDRYDVLKESVKIVYEECKVYMEASINKSNANFAKLTLLETEEDTEKLYKELDKLRGQWNTQRDNLYNAKLQEIEDAHNKWLAEQDELERKRQEDEAAHGDKPATTMRMDRTDIN